ncbi:hypothetical protein CYG49_01795 [Candidatus Saccharibacteria bacterium]|nr:MAG: hypothetical protein CYG49_01795 [Candidatus Saccharibacteria bacterium]
MKQNNQSGFTAIEAGLAAIGIVLVGLIGYRVYDANMNKQTQNNSITEQATVEDEILSAELTDLASLATITSAAVQEKQGVTVVHIELEQAASGLVYKAELSDGTVVVYNARTGAKLKTLTETEKTTEQLPATFSGGIGFAKALEIAKTEKPNSKVFKIELELEGGIVVYSVRFTDKARVDVNAADGSIVRTKAARPTETPTPQTGGSERSQEVRQDAEHRAEQSTNRESGSSNSGSGSSNSGSGGSNSGRSGGSDDHMSDSDDDDDIDNTSDDNGDDDSSGRNSGRGSRD